MANEFQQLPNPDNVPGGVTSGYQRQNTNILALQTGLDTTEPYDNGNGIITIPMGGIVEVNGVMFKLTVTVTLAKPVASAAYWVALTDNEDGTADIELVTRPGAWTPAKKGCYTAQNTRTLNWASMGDLAYNPGGGAEYSSPTVKGMYTAQLPSRGWKFFRIASGIGGGNGLNGLFSGGAGGVPSVAVTKTAFFFYDGGDIQIYIGANGGAGGKGGYGSFLSEGGGGGGGGGSGEASFLRYTFMELSTEESPVGLGGSGTNYRHGNGGAGGNVGGRGADGTTQSGWPPYNTTVTAPGSGGAGGGVGMNGGNGGADGAGGGGGGGGILGKNQPNGAPGGYCNIIALV